MSELPGQDLKEEGKINGMPEACYAQGLKERYDFKCPCGSELIAAPSLLMSMGINRGGGLCPDCTQWLTLSIDDDNERMTAHVEAVRVLRGDDANDG